MLIIKKLIYKYMTNQNYRFFQCDCGKKTKISAYATEYQGECLKCKTKHNNIVFAKNMSEISESEF